MKIPNGWKRIMRGKLQKTDRVWDMREDKFVFTSPDDIDYIGDNIESYYCVIREGNSHPHTKIFI